MNKNYQLVNEQYTFGSYNRKNFIGYNLSYQMDYHDLIIDVTTENRFIRDKFMETMMKKKIITPKEYEKYMKGLDTVLGDLQQYGTLANEDILTEAQHLRQKALQGHEVAYMKLRQSEIREQIQIYIEDKEVESQELAIDQRDYQDKLSSESEAVIVLPGHYKEVCRMLRTIADYRKSGLQVYVIAKTMRCSPFLSLMDLKFIREVAELENVHIIEEPTDVYGYDLSVIQLTNELSDWLSAGRLFLHGLGELSLFAVKQLSINAIVEMEVTQYLAKCVTNLELGERALIFIPKNLDIFDYVPIVEKSALNYYILDQLSKAYGDGIYDKSIGELRASYPGFFMNLSSRDLSHTNPLLTVMKPRKEFQNEQIFNQGKKSAIGDYIGEKNKEIEYLSEYYDICELKLGEKVESGILAHNKILVDGVCMSNVEAVNVLLSDDGQVLYPEDIAKEKKKRDSLSIFSNFLFFLTPKVADFYNKCRSNRELEQISINSGHLDYKRYIKGGEKIETFPLYNKPMMYYTGEGKIGFTRFQLAGGEVIISGEKISWESKDVNSKEQDAEVIVYTPNGADDNVENHYTYRKKVGHGRVNIVIVNDQIISIREGDVVLPALGVAISLQPDSGLTYIDRLGLCKDHAGYYKVKNLKLKVNLWAPKGWTNEKWQSVLWAFGGALTLIDEGEEVFSGADGGMEVLRKEGWLNPLSMQTQESTIHELQRHPRTCIGVTRDSRFFILVFSGRTKKSVGANYLECCKIAKELLGDIKYMINVDGGASSVLGIHTQQECLGLSYPAASNNTCAGMVRPLNSILVIEA